VTVRKRPLTTDPYTNYDSMGLINHPTLKLGG
jgi:hypothetical protein